MDKKRKISLTLNIISTALFPLTAVWIYLFGLSYLTAYYIAGTLAISLALGIISRIMNRKSTWAEVNIIISMIFIFLSVILTFMIIQGIETVRSTFGDPYPFSLG